MKLLITVLIVLIGVSVLVMGWDYYMRSTWDAKIKASFQFYQLKKSGEEWAEEITPEEADIIVNGRFPRQVTIIKNKEGYAWENNNGAPLTKSKVGKGKVYAKYTARDEKEYIKVQTNMFAWAGCGARNHYWSSGNLQYHKVLDSGDKIIAFGQNYAYENIFQYLFCYEMNESQHSILNSFSQILN